MSSRWTRWTIIAALALSAEGAAALDCPKACALPEKPLAAHASIDANTGRLIDGAVSYPQGTPVQVTFANKNPFKYAYRFQVASELLSSAIISEFLASIPGMKVAGPRAGPPPVAPACSGAPADRNDLFARISASGSGTETSFQKIAAYPDAFNAFRELADVDSIASPAECEKLCEAAVSLSAKRADFDPATVDAASAAFAAELAANDASIAALDPAGNSADPCVRAIKSAQSSAKQRKTQSDATAAELKAKLTAPEASASYRQMDRILRAALESGAPFVESRFPVPSDEAAAIRVEVYRRNLWVAQSPEQSVTAMTITVGRSRFSISAGVGVSSIGEDRFGRQPLVVRNADGTTALSTQIGYSDRSDFSAGLLFALNGMIYSGERLSWGLSTGIVLANRNGESQVEYVLSPLTLGFLSEHLFLSLGIHLAQVRTLAGGFSVGQEVPSGLQDPIPTTRRWRAGTIGTLTYRVR